MRLLFFLDLIVLQLCPLTLQGPVLPPQEAIAEAPDPPEGSQAQAQPPGAPVQQAAPCDHRDPDKGPSVASQTPAIAAKSSTQTKASETESWD